MKVRVAGAFCVGLAVLLGAFAVPGLVRSTGLAGTRGTLAVQICGTSGYGRGTRTVCRGTFRPAAGGPADVRASIATEYDPGERVAVTRSGGAYYSVTPQAFLGWLGLDCFAAALACVGAPMLALGAAARKGAAGLRLPLRLARGFLIAVPVCAAAAVVFEVA
ncbi:MULTISPECIES: hypothetical protein [Streptomyces]|uniref:DUF3592 domain-containing protein n=1 Tax=Streptomyces luteosporeus TaxID=173856 RepID=A0ABP6G9N8_9ACTN